MQHVHYNPILSLHVNKTFSMTLLDTEKPKEISISNLPFSISLKEESFGGIVSAELVYRRRYSVYKSTLPTSINNRDKKYVETILTYF